MPHELTAPRQTALRLVATNEIRLRTALKPEQVDEFYRYARYVPEKVQQLHLKWLMREGYIQRGSKTLDGWTVQLTTKGGASLLG